MPFIIAFKKEMTERFRDDSLIPITVLKVSSCVVTQIKTKEKDGYTAVQVGALPLKKERKSSLGKNFHHLREFRVKEDEIKTFELGKKVEASSFKVGDKVTVTSSSKGRGFAGVVKRHHFHGHPPGHGNKDAARAPGSIGQAGIQRVFKGMRMAGRMGGSRVTIKNLEIIDIDAEKNLLFLKGAVAGARNALVLLATS